MDRQRLALLKRQLIALDYTDDFDEKSAALVARLAEDVMKITETYRNEKL